MNQKSLEKWDKTKGVGNIIRYLLIEKEASFQEIKKIAGYSGSGDQEFLVQLSRNKCLQSANKIGKKPILVNKNRKKKGFFGSRIYSLNPRWLSDMIADNPTIISPLNPKFAEFSDKHHMIIHQLYWESPNENMKISLRENIDSFAESLKIMANRLYENEELKRKLRTKYLTEEFDDLVHDLIINQKWLINPFLLHKLFHN